MRRKKARAKKKPVKKKITALSLIKNELELLRREKNEIQNNYNTLNYHRGVGEANFVVMKQTIAEQAERIKSLEDRIINS